MGISGRIARRSFLIGSAAIVGGVAFGSYYVTRPVDNPLLKDIAEGEVAITPFVKITKDGITLIVPRADVGQGIISTQAHLIAEELDVDPHHVNLDPGQPHPAYANVTIAANSLPFHPLDESFIPSTARNFMTLFSRLSGTQFTGGSSSVTDLHHRLRTAGAVARETLKTAASSRTGVAVSKLRTENGHVVLPDGEKINYTALAADAARIDPVEKVELREPKHWRRLGKPFQRTDIPAKSTGKQKYGIDVVLPGMLYATVRANPGRGSGIGRYDSKAAQSMRGVRAVVKVSDGLGIIADNTWRAFRAAAAVEIEWKKPSRPSNSAAMWRILEEAATEENQNSRLRDDGDVVAAMNGKDVITAEYRTPYLAHAALEPLSATVLVETDQVIIWTATQIPSLVRDTAAELTGVRADRVIVNVLPAGGSFGRRLDQDYVIQAIEIAMAVPGTPVKTTWSREEDMARDFPRPLHLARGRGTIENGRVVAYDLDSISSSLADDWLGRVFFTPPGPDALLVWGAYDQPYRIPNYRVTGYRVSDLVPGGLWRSPGASSNAFFHESFLSELIRAAGADPLHERLRLIEDSVSRQVLEAVGEMSSWQGPNIGKNRGRGIAFSHYHHVPVGVVIDVSMTERGLRIDEVWIAADCGTVFDPVNAEAQLTGAAVFGLGHAMNCEITYKDFAPIQTNYHAFEGMRLYQTPSFHTRLLENNHRVRGLGDQSTGPAAPALADAIFSATGERLRELPFNRQIDFV